MSGDARDLGWSEYSVDLIRKLEALSALEVHLVSPAFDRLRDDIARRNGLDDDAKQAIDWLRIGHTRVVRQVVP